MTPEQNAWLVDLAAKTGVGCRDWPWAKSHGYAIASVDGRSQRVGHLILEALGEARPGVGHDAVQIHECDRPICVAPWHLRWGSQSENLLDMTTKGRRVTAKGEAQGHSLLTEEQVVKIRSLWERGHSQSELARSFGVTQPNIHNIVRRKSWRHVA